MPDTPPTAEERENAIAESVTGPQSVSSDGVTVTQRSVSDQIMAEEYLRSRENAAGTRTRGIGISYLRGGGTR